MRKIIKCFYCGAISFILLFIYSLNVYAASDAKTKEFMNNHSEILKSIKECSECINRKGDIRIDFLEEVIYFNDIQICMAENIIKCGDNKEVRNIAKSLIKNSMECTTELNEILYNISKDTLIDEELEDKYMNDYKQLYKKMVINLQCTRDDENIEKIFLRASIKHYESLIELTEIFGKYCKNKDILETAKDIKCKNSKEVKKLKTIFNKCS